jgi:hypothetical protein
VVIAAAVPSVFVLRVRGTRTEWFTVVAKSTQ